MTASSTLAPPAVDALRDLLHRHHRDLPDTDPDRILALVESGRTAQADGAELTELAIAAAAGLTAEEPAYARLAARLLAGRIADETAAQGITGFGDSVAAAYAEELLDPASPASSRRTPTPSTA